MKQLLVITNVSCQTLYHTQPDLTTLMIVSVSMNSSTLLLLNTVNSHHQRTPSNCGKIDAIIDQSCAPSH